MRASLPLKRSPWLVRSGSAQSRCQQAVRTCSKINLANVAADFRQGLPLQPACARAVTQLRTLADRCVACHDILGVAIKQNN